MNVLKLELERTKIIERIDEGFKLVTQLAKEQRDKIKKTNQNLFVPLLEKEIKQLLSADGDELEWKAAKPHSSLCLMLNVFSSLREGKRLVINGIGTYETYELEKKLQVLENSSRKANIDMLLSNDDSLVYIESKFTELFYYHNDYTISDAYSNEERYPSKDIYNASIKLLSKCKYYASDQLIKHCIGIYRDCIDNPTKYENKDVYLLNLNWEINNDNSKFDESYQLQLEALKEAIAFSESFNESMKKVFKNIGVNFKFAYINYYDFINKQTNITQLDKELVEYLNRRYFSI